MSECVCIPGVELPHVNILSLYALLKRLTSLCACGGGGGGGGVCGVSVCV